jgi:hypothetical protein
MLDVASFTRKKRALRRAPTVLVAESLGSKTITDAVLCWPETDGNQERLAEQLGTTTQIFLFANQIPLLNLGFNNETCPGLGDYQREEKTNGKLGAFEAFLQWIADKKRELDEAEKLSKAAQEPLQVIAFTDPNDVLSYALAPEDVRSPELLVNVIVSNAPTWLTVLENPYRAHTGYGANEEIMGYLGCGKAREARAPRLLDDCLDEVAVPEAP